MHEGREGLHVAVVGASGLVGREMLAALEARQFPVRRLTCLASTRSAGEHLSFRGADHRIEVAQPARFAGVDLVLMSAGSAASAALAPAAAAAGAVVVDNSAQFRLDPEVPLVVPEVNADALTGVAARRIVANPNCATIQAVLALAPLHRAATLTRVVLTTYQAVSGRGRRGLDELGDQVRALYSQQDVVSAAFPRRIAFSCLPHIGALGADGGAGEEHKLRDETRKILAAPALGVGATCVRVPVFTGHCVAIHAAFARPLGAAAARTLLQAAPGVKLIDDAARGIYPTPEDIDAEGHADVALVGRVRADDSCEHGLALWCVADNLRRGAATNAVMVAEALLARGLLQHGSPP